MNRNPFVLPLALIVAGVALGGAGLFLANSSAPVLVQILALVLMSVAAVALLFALGGLVSALVLSLSGRGGEDGEDE